MKAALENVDEKDTELANQIQVNIAMRYIKRGVFCREN